MKMKAKIVSAFVCLTMLGGANLFAQERVDLTVGIVDPTSPIPGKGKTPVQVPILWQDGYEFTVQGGHADYTVSIVQNGFVVYTLPVPMTATSFTLPSWLEGTYEIDLYGGGTYYFYGEIILINN